MKHIEAYDPDYIIKRNDDRAKTACNLSALYLNTYYSLKYENTERLNDLADKGFIILPKHQSWIDIILTGVLLKKILCRCGNYIMKDSLPKQLLEPLGGISIIRRKDLDKLMKKSKNRDEQRAALQKAKEIRELIGYETINLLLKDEIVVNYIEGTRKYKADSKITTGPPLANIRGLLKIQKLMGKQITFVPLDIKYENKYEPRSSIVVKVANPIEVPDNGLEQLTGHLINEIALFS